MVPRQCPWVQETGNKEKRLLKPMGNGVQQVECLHWEGFPEVLVGWRHLMALQVHTVLWLRRVDGIPVWDRHLMVVLRDHSCIHPKTGEAECMAVRRLVTGVVLVGVPQDLMVDGWVDLVPALMTTVVEEVVVDAVDVEDEVVEDLVILMSVVENRMKRMVVTRAVIVAIADPAILVTLRLATDHAQGHGVEETAPEMHLKVVVGIAPRMLVERGEEIETEVATVIVSGTEIVAIESVVIESVTVVVTEIVIAVIEIGVSRTKTRGETAREALPVLMTGTLESAAIATKVVQDPAATATTRDINEDTRYPG